MKKQTLGLVLLAACGLTLTAVSPVAARGNRDHTKVAPGQAKRLGVGAVYAMTNGVNGNAVAMFRRTIDGTLIPAGTIPTGGRGTGNLLENQGALI